MTFALLTAVLASADAPELPVAEWLAPSGVRLLVVVSVPQKCADCAKHAAGWRKLQERHRARGLRTAAILGRDPMLGCVEPDWQPELATCDSLYDGLAREYRLPEKRETAFLWDWRGRLLVNHGDPAAIERAVERELSSTAMLVVDPRSAPRELAADLRSAIAASNRWTVAPPSLEQARRGVLGDASYLALYLERPLCEPGAGLDTDARLGISVAKDRADLTLMSEGGCRLASAVMAATASGEEMVAALLAKLRRKVQLPEAPREAPIATAELIPEGSTPEATLQKSKQRIASITDPIGKQLALAVAEHLGDAQLTPTQFVRLVLEKTFGRDVGETLDAQLASGPEVALDLRDPKDLQPGDLIFYVSYAYVPRVVLLYLGQGLVAEAADVRGVVVQPLPAELPYFLQSVARRPLARAP